MLIVPMKFLRLPHYNPVTILKEVLSNVLNNVLIRAKVKIASPHVLRREQPNTNVNLLGSCASSTSGVEL